MMSGETVNLSIPFEVLLQTIAQLNSTEKERLWKLLDDELHDDDEDAGVDPQEAEEVAQAYREYEAGDYLTLDEYVAQRARPTP
jgi:hypothetical protein